MRAIFNKERRYASRIPLDISLTEEFGEQVQDVVAMNISEYGIRYKRSLSSPRCRHQEVFLTFSLMKQLQSIKVLGWVVDEHEQDGYLEAHVTFMYLSEQDGATIRDFVAAREKNRA